MIRLTQEKVMVLHELLIRETGGSPELRDAGLLNSALESAFQTFGGMDLYPTTEEKGARLGYALIANHAFADGNKRIGIFILLIFLRLNGVFVTPTVEDVIRITMAVASGDTGYAGLLDWVRTCPRSHDPIY